MRVNVVYKTLIVLGYISTPAFGIPVGFPKGYNDTSLRERDGLVEDVVAYCEFYDGDGNANPMIGVKGWNHTDPALFPKQLLEDQVLNCTAKPLTKGGSSSFTGWSQNIKIGRVHSDETIYDWVGTWHFDSHDASYKGCLADAMYLLAAPGQD